MGGFCDGVSKLWIVRAQRGLDVDGFNDEVEAIGALIRRAITWGGPDVKARISAAVGEALRHDEEDSARDGKCEPSRCECVPPSGMCGDGPDRCPECGLLVPGAEEASGG